MRACAWVWGRSATDCRVTSAPLLSLTRQCCPYYLQARAAPNAAHVRTHAPAKAVQPRGKDGRARPRANPGRKGAAQGGQHNGRSGACALRRCAVACIDSGRAPARCLRGRRAGGVQQGLGNQHLGSGYGRAWANRVCAEWAVIRRRGPGQQSGGSPVSSACFCRAAAHRYDRECECLAGGAAWRPATQRIQGAGRAGCCQGLWGTGPAPAPACAWGYYESDSVCE